MRKCSMNKFEIRSRNGVLGVPPGFGEEENRGRHNRLEDGEQSGLECVLFCTASYYHVQTVTILGWIWFRELTSWTM